jgi:hypothetical protein
MTNKVLEFLPTHISLQKILVIFIACILLGACVNERTLVGRIRSGVLPIGSEGADAPELFVIRSDVSDFLSNKFGLSHKIVVDDVDVFFLDAWRYTNFVIAPGNHKIGVKCFGGWSESWKEDNLTIMFESKGTYYFKISQNLRCASITLIDASEGLSLIRESRHIPFEHDLPQGYKHDDYLKDQRWNLWTGGMSIPSQEK